MVETSSNITPLTPEQVQEATVQVTNLPVLYFNHSRIVTSNFDLRIFFGQGNITAQGKQTLVEQLCVIVTPEFADIFAKTLKVALEKFEERFGKIRLDEEISLPIGAVAGSPKSRKKRKT